MHPDDETNDTYDSEVHPEQAIAEEGQAPAAMHDSGKRQEFTTGAVRDTASGKSRPDLISPFSLMELGDWLREGAEKYTERNWEIGIPMGRCAESHDRHWLQFKQGDNSENHLVAAFCNIMFMLHTRAMIERGVLPAELDDMPQYQPKQEP